MDYDKECNNIAFIVIKDIFLYCICKVTQLKTFIDRYFNDTKLSRTQQRFYFKQAFNQVFNR